MSIAEIQEDITQLYLTSNMTKEFEGGEILEGKLGEEDAASSLNLANFRKRIFRKPRIAENPDFDERCRDHDVKEQLSEIELIEHGEQNSAKKTDAALVGTCKYPTRISWESACDSVIVHDEKHHRVTFDMPCERQLSSSTSQKRREIEVTTQISPVPRELQFSDVEISSLRQSLLAAHPMQNTVKSILAGKLEGVPHSIIEQLEGYFTATRDETNNDMISLRSICHDVEEQENKLRKLIKRRSDSTVAIMRKLCKLSETEIAIRRLTRHFMETSDGQYNVHVGARTELAEVEREQQQTGSIRQHIQKLRRRRKRKSSAPGPSVCRSHESSSAPQKSEANRRAKNLKRRITFKRQP